MENCLDCLRHPERALKCDDAGYSGHPGNCHRNGNGRFWTREPCEAYVEDTKVTSHLTPQFGSGHVDHFDPPIRAEELD